MIEISIVQFAPRLGEVDANIKTIERLLKPLKSQLIVLPELANSGYRFADVNEAKSASETVEESAFLAALKYLANEKDAYIVTGFCELDGNDLYNSSVLIGPNGVIGVYRKLHLFWDEKSIFKKGNMRLPVFDTSIGKVGMLVCFDWMFPEAWRSLALKGAQIIAHPSNLVLPYCQSVIPSCALVNRYFVATSNRIGTEKDLTFTGQSILASPTGETLLRASDNNEEILTTRIDLDRANDKFITPRNDAFADRRNDVYGDLNIKM